MRREGRECGEVRERERERKREKEREKKRKREGGGGVVVRSKGRVKSQHTPE